MRYRLELEPILNKRTAAAEAYLSPKEQVFYTGLKFEKRRGEWLAGRIAAKRLVRILIEESGILLKDDEITIEKSADGVPFVKMMRNSWPLSISHSGEWAVAAMSSERYPAPIGVDIEKIEDRDDAWLDIAFHPLEKADALNSTEQTRLWTAKEAVSKLLGIGLSVDLRDIRFSQGSQTPELSGKAQKAWESQGSPSIFIDSSFPRAGYAMSLSCALSPVTIKEEIHG